MRSRLGIFFDALALLQILGGHWALLQTGAWAGMIVQCSEQVGIKAGVVETFDGAHPCPVCLAIKDGKKQEQKRAPLLQAELKKDFLAPWNRFQVHPVWVEVNYPGLTTRMPGIVFDLVVPLPRNV
jgi:hypothetical protein